MGRTWVIVLAGGEGSRLAGEARRRYGYPRPKQYCDFDGTGSLLDKTLERARLLAPDHRIVVATHRGHRPESEPALAPYPRVIEVAQPLARDTTPGILLPLLEILRRDPKGTVAVLPSDHHIEDPDAFAVVMEQALDWMGRDPSSLALLGATPEGPEEGYGWIQPGDSDGPGARVIGFREKPAPDVARALIGRGALLNTFVMAGAAQAFAHLFRLHAAGWWRALTASYDRPDLLEATYEVLPASNFSRDVLEKALPLLRVLPLGEVGWSDIGTPDRLWRALQPLPVRVMA